MVPIELKILIQGVQYFDEQTNEEKLGGNLDSLEELQDIVSMRTTAYQQWETQYH